MSQFKSEQVEGTRPSTYQLQHNGPPTQGSSLSQEVITPPQDAILQQQTPASCSLFQSDFRNVVQFLCVLSMIHNIFIAFILVVALAGLVFPFVKRHYGLNAEELPKQTSGYLLYVASYYFVVTVFTLKNVHATTHVWFATKLRTPSSKGIHMFVDWTITSWLLILEEVIVSMVYTYVPYLKYFLPEKFPLIAAFSLTLRIVYLYFNLAFKSELKDSLVQIRPSSTRQISGPETTAQIVKRQ